jgi:hypothetical protein
VNEGSFRAIPGRDAIQGAEHVEASTCKRMAYIFVAGYPRFATRVAVAAFAA